MRGAGPNRGSGKLLTFVSSQSDLDDFRLELTRPAPSRPYSGKASPEMVTWIRDDLDACPVSRRALARRARVTPESICSIEEGRHATGKDVAVQVAAPCWCWRPADRARRCWRRKWAR